MTVPWSNKVRVGDRFSKGWHWVSSSSNWDITSSVNPQDSPGLLNQKLRVGALRCVYANTPEASDAH